MEESMKQQLCRLIDRVRLHIDERQAARVEKALYLLESKVSDKAAVKRLLKECCRHLDSSPSRRYSIVYETLRELNGLEKSARSIPDQSRRSSDDVPLCQSNTASPLPPVGNAERNSESWPLPPKANSDIETLRWKLARLRALLDRISARIQELEESEINLDELESSSSAYIRQAKLEKRAVLVCKHINSICYRLRKQGYEAGMHYPLSSKFNCRLSRYPEIDRHVCKLVTHGYSPTSHRRKYRTNRTNILCFPDYQDIRSLVTRLLSTGKVSKLEHKDLFEPDGDTVDTSAVDQLSRKIFRKIGDLLQAHRRQKLHESMLSRVSPSFDYNHDPAMAEPALKSQLELSRLEFEKKMTTLIDNYADLDGQGQPSSNQDDICHNSSEAMSRILDVLESASADQQKVERPDVSQAAKQNDSSKITLNDQDTSSSADVIIID